MRFLALFLLCVAARGESLRYWVQPCTGPESGCHSDDPELAQWALAAWQAASGERLMLEETTNRDRSHIRIYWAGGDTGQYGETRVIMVDGVRGAEVFVLPTVVPPGERDGLLRDAIVYLTCLHEIGHALGLEHTAAFDDIMYSFQYGGDIAEYFGRYRRQLSTRADIRKHSGMSAQDRKRLGVVIRQRMAADREK